MTLKGSSWPTHPKASIPTSESSISTCEIGLPHLRLANDLAERLKLAKVMVCIW